MDAKTDICLKSWRVENLFSVKSLTEALLPGVAASTQGPSAAVAAVMREGDLGVEMLFIERARKVGDPWSGQMAFPGGRTSRVTLTLWLRLKERRAKSLDWSYPTQML